MKEEIIIIRSLICWVDMCIFLPTKYELDHSLGSTSHMRAIAL